ncbi:MAG: general secretion pathway protein GspB [Desulfocapsa sp.]|nr:general secretion pathway protein GspB [Desulfocapsa sp.]
MSFILNALKKAENKSFEDGSVKIRKQVLVLKQRTRKIKIKYLSLFALCLGVLFIGWLLGQMQNNQLDDAADLTTTHVLTNDKAVQHENNEFFLEKKIRGDHPKVVGGGIPSEALDDSTFDTKNQNLTDETKEINPPIPVRAVEKSVVTESVQNSQEQSELKKVVEPLQNYSDLPFSIKQKLPPLQISLHFYHSTPARRIVRINGKILHENDSIEDGLIVQEIKSTTAVFSYNGYLFELNAPGG